MAAISKEQWQDARKDWEDGLSLDRVSKKYGVSVTTVRGHKEKEGWVRNGEPVDPPDTPDTVPAAILPQVHESVALEEALAELAALKAERDTLAAQVGQLARDVKLDLPTTPEGVVEFFGREHIEFIALNRFNRERKSRGFNPVELTAGEPALENAIRKTAEEFLKRQKKWGGESALRTIKMAKADPETPTGWRVVAIPWEPTINQPVSGPEGAKAAIDRYLRKGFKVISPQLCHRGPCYVPAAIENGRLKYHGYCSAEHEAGDPFLNAKTAKGVTTSAVAMSTGADLAMVVR